VIVEQRDYHVVTANRILVPTSFSPLA